MTLRTAALACIVIALIVVACGNGSDVAPSTAGDTTPTAPSEPTQPAEAPVLDGLRDRRYCEVFTIGADDDGDGLLEAGVWNTMPLNDCPQEAFESIDLERAASDLGAVLAVANGPRYWVLDSITAVTLGPGTIHDFGGISMRLAATVMVTPARAPYTELSVARDTVFGFSADRDVPVLIAPDGSWYVMQSYSLEVDPELTFGALPGIRPQLQLPEGWMFEVRTLEEPLDVLSHDGVATVIQDDLRNTYQLVARD